MSIESELKKVITSLNRIGDDVAAIKAVAIDPAALAGGPADAPSETEQPTDTAKQPEEQGAVPTVEDLYNKASAAVQNKELTVKAVTDVLSVFGVKAIKELKPDQIAEANKLIDEQLAKAAGVSSGADNPF